MTPPGGKREGAGRPPKRRRDLKSKVVRVRVTEAEWREMERLLRLWYETGAVSTVAALWQVVQRREDVYD